MKITAIKTANFLGARNVDVRLGSPVTLICGRNHSGKSSLAEAVRMALTGESVRVSLKKEYGRMLTEGQTVGYVVVDHDGHQSAITLPNGAHEHTNGNGSLQAVLPYVLDAQRFSILPCLINLHIPARYGLPTVKSI
jgi:recombinational DNA repair ATPase RecF